MHRITLVLNISQITTDSIIHSNIRSLADIGLKALSIVATLFLLFVLGSAASAATFVVTKTADTNDGVCDSDCSLREAVAAANTAATGDVIEFDSVAFATAQIIILSEGEISVINQGSLTINGPTPELTITSNLQSRIFYLSSINAPQFTITLNNLTLAAGNSNDTGGCVYKESVKLTINDSIIRDCRANSGGGIYNSLGTLVINDSVITGNVANGGGGGINGGGTNTVLTINNSTITGNTSFDQGGGIKNGGGTTATFTNVTIASNSASDGGGIYNFFNGTTTNLRNSIVAQNSSSGGAPDFSGTLTSHGYNLIGNIAGTSITGNTTGNIVGQNPLLGPLQDNGGSTPTRALLAGSPAIDAADPNDPLATDQRGVPRPLDGDLNSTAVPDVGAFEAGAHVVTKTVDTNDGVCDADCSLREAIATLNISSAENVVIFSEIFDSPKIISLSVGQLVIPQNAKITIIGPGASQLAVDGNNQSRVFFIDSGASVMIGGLSVTGGNGVGSLFSDWGGGIFNRGTSLTLNDVVITNNLTSSVSGSGGGIYNYRSSLQIFRSTISNNGAYNGGGIFNSNFGGVLGIEGSTVSGNIAGFGAGIYNQGTSNIDTSTISENDATNSGGGIYDAGGIGVTNSTIRSNSAVSGGGGIYINAASSGGVLTTSTVSNNSAGFGGGGVSNGSSLNIVSSSISDNVSNNQGGGIDSSGPLSLIGSTVNANTATEFGGGIKNSKALTISNSTVSNNIANGNFGGGGIFSEIIGNGTANITNATISFNQAPHGGGGINNNLGTFNLKNSIIANNTSAVVGRDLKGEIISQGFNLILDLNGVTITGTTTGNILGKDPQLATLRNNGGPTKTIALLPTSPAIDAGDPDNFPAADQRGVARPQDGDLNGTAVPDIGAYERQVTQFVVTKTADANDGVCDADCSLREAVAATNAAATPDNAIVFDAGVFASPQMITLARGELDIVNDATLFINGPGSGLLTINGNNQSRVFTMQPLANVSISGLTITGGNGAGTTDTGSGGGIYNSGTLSISNAAISGNSATGSSGGGIRNTNVGSLSVSNSIIFGNATNFGAGIFNSGGTVTLTGTVISGNIAALNAGGVLNDGALTVIASTISANKANGLGGNAGGGILNEGTSFAVTNSTISGNTASGGTSGGGIWTSTNGSITNSTITNNSATGAGSSSGVFRFNGTFSVRNCIIAANQNNAARPDVVALGSTGITSNGYNLVGNPGSVTFSSPGDQFGTGASPLDPRLGTLANNGGSTPTHSLLLGSPAIDAGSASGSNYDQRGLARTVDLAGIVNVADGTDIGAFEAQSLPIGPHGATFDFDGDGKTDLSIFRPNGATGSEWWYLKSSNGANFATQFGTPTDKLVAADYTGDGKADIAFFRPSTGFWYILRSEDSSFYAFPFGANGDIPAPADFDGDGKADAAVFRPSTATWFIQNSGGGTTIQAFGAAGDVPVVGDYDGDGKADIAIFRPNGATGSEWWILRSTAGLIATQFGTPTDKTVPGDYTGDGKADVAIWRPSNGQWYILRSEDLSFYAFPFGANGDIPVPGDYDGDGKTDAAVFRPASSTWFAQGSTSGTIIQQFGAAGDVPVPSEFVR